MRPVTLGELSRDTTGSLLEARKISEPGSPAAARRRGAVSPSVILAGAWSYSFTWRSRATLHSQSAQETHSRSSARVVRFVTFRTNCLILISLHLHLLPRLLLLLPLLYVVAVLPTAILTRRIKGSKPLVPVTLSPTLWEFSFGVRGKDCESYRTCTEGQYRKSSPSIDRTAGAIDHVQMRRLHRSFYEI